MNKKGFLEKLKSELNGYSPEEVDRSIAFYSEMIDDRIEDGADEEEAVASIGSIEEIVNQIKLELPLGTLIREKAKSVKEKHESGSKESRAFTIVLLILGSPVWLPVLLSVLCTVFWLYLTLWILVLTLWIVEAACVITAFASVIGGVVALFENSVLGMLSIGIGLICGGLSILMFYAALYSVKGMVAFTKWIVKSIKLLIIRGKKEA